MSSGDTKDQLVWLGAWRKPFKPTLLWFGLPIEPGRKYRHSVMAEKPWRSKYMTAWCLGQGKRCKAGECKHVEFMASRLRRCRPVPRPSTSQEGDG